MRQSWEMLGTAFGLESVVMFSTLSLVCLSQSICETLDWKIVEFGDLCDVYVFNMSVPEFLLKKLTCPQLSGKVTLLPPPHTCMGDERVREGRRGLRSDHGVPVVLPALLPTRQVQTSRPARCWSGCPLSPE